MARTPKPIPISELATFLGVEVAGEADTEIRGFGSLPGAQADEMAFIRDASHLHALEDTLARAFLAPEGLDLGARLVLRSANPSHDFSRLIAHFAPRPRPAPGIAPGAHADATASIDPSASVEPGARIGPDCQVGARTVVGANATLEARVEVGEDGWIHSGAVLRADTIVGSRVVIGSGTVLGGEGFGLVPDAEGRPVAMVQRGRVVVEEDVEIGANSTIDRATLDETRIGRGTKIDSQVHVAHNCRIGEDVLIAAQTGLSGGTIVGDRAILMGGVGTTGHLRIGEDAFIAARAGLHHDVPAGARMYGAPATEERSWHRTVAGLRRLPELLKRVRRLERAFEHERPGAESDRSRDDRDGGAPPASGGDSGAD